MKAPLIIFSAWCNFVLLIWTLLPSCPYFLDDCLIKSSQSKYENVRVGFVRGMCILKFFPWQLITRPERVPNFPSSLLILIDFPISSDFGESVKFASFWSHRSSVVLSCPCCNSSVLSLGDSSSVNKIKKTGQSLVKVDKYCNIKAWNVKFSWPLIKRFGFLFISSVFILFVSSFSNIVLHWPILASIKSRLLWML